MKLSRRNFIKRGVIAGITVYTVPALAQFKLDLDGQSNQVSPELYEKWSTNGETNFRIDAIAKVTGEKIYGRDLRATDIEGWPNSQAFAYYIRATKADQLYEGIDIDFLPAPLKPIKIITAEMLEQDGIVLPHFYGKNPLVKIGTVPDYLGQAVALLIFDNFLAYSEAKSLLQFNPSVVKYGAKAPLAYKTMNPWGVHRITRMEGNPAGTLPDKYSPLQNGLPHVDYVDYKPNWPAPNANGTPLEQQMAVASEISKNFENEDYYILNRTYKTQFVDPMFMEPECFNGWYDEKTQTFHTIPTLQSIEDFYTNVANMLANGPLAGKVKDLIVHSPYVGGGFGGKDHSITAYYGLIAAMYHHNPVRLANDRFEQFQSGLKRHPFIMENRLAVDKKTGKFQGIISNMQLDGGGRANLSSAVASVGASGLQSIYYFPQNDITAVAYVSENPAAGSMRGFGTVQTMFAMENMVNEAAQVLNIDPIELRLRNALQPGQANTQGGVPTSPERYTDILKEVQKHDMWTKRAERKKAHEAKYPNQKFGTGFAICTKKFGTGNDAPATYIEMNEKGQLIAGITAVEMGTGAQTGQAAVMSKYLGHGADIMNLTEVKTWDALQMQATKSPYAMTEDYVKQMQQNPRWVTTKVFDSAASNSAYFQSKTTENAAKIIFRYGLWPAAKAIWSKLYFSGSQYADINFGAPEEATWVDGKLTTRGFIPLDLPTLAQYAHQHGFVTSAMVHSYNSWAWVEADFTIEGETQRYELDAVAVKYGKGASKDKQALMTSQGWHVLDRTNTAYPSPALRHAMGTYYAPCATIVDVAIDMGSGATNVIRTQSWVDAGQVIVKELVEGQLEGGIAMGIGHALYETLPSGEEGPGNGTWNLNRYQVSRANNVGVWEMNSILVPPVGKNDQYKGIAEVVMIPVIPAIIEAIYQATGTRFYHTPVTPADMREALQ